MLLMVLAFSLNASADNYYENLLISPDPPCDNVTYAGEISTAGFGCSDYDVPELSNISEPSGGSGDLEIIWIKRPGPGYSWEVVHVTRLVHWHFCS